MKVQELMQQAQDELNVEQQTAAKEILKQRLVEVAMAEKVLANMKAGLNALLDMDVADAAADGE